MGWVVKSLSVYIQSRGKKNNTLLKHLWLGFKTTGVETFRGKGAKKAFNLAVRPQLRSREGSPHDSPGNTQGRNLSQESREQSVWLQDEARIQRKFQKVYLRPLLNFEY